MLNFKSKLPVVETSIFSVMSAMANAYGAINLSQGFPDFDCDPKLIDLVTHAMRAGKNQYAPTAGLTGLRETISKYISKYYHYNYNPDSEITVTAGATEAIFTAIAATVSIGDEVIIFEPAYDCYAPTITLFGGVVKAVSLRPPDYKIDWDLVANLISTKTKMIIINSPQNPTGAVLTDDDMQQLIKLTEHTDIILLSDEVYGNVVFDEQEYRSVIKYEALRLRSFVTYSFGKMLHTTGWKIGFCLAPQKLMAEFRKVHQFNVFSVNTPMQQGISDYLNQSNQVDKLGKFFQYKRDYFRNLLKKSRFDLLPCNGSYFQCVSYSNISKESDLDFTKRLITDFDVAAIPVSAFYQNGNDYKIIRLCFAKEEETLKKAAEKLITV